MNIVNPYMLGEPPQAPYPVDAADFDGADTLRRAASMTGQAASKVGIFSVWTRFDSFGASGKYILDSGSSAAGSPIAFTVADFGLAQFILTNSIGSAIYQQNAGVISTAQWYHFIWAWDLANSYSKCYVNDVLVETAASPLTNEDVQFNNADDWLVGKERTTTLFNHDGGMAELYLAPGQFLDITVLSNRRKFIGSSKKPVNLGATGSTPTGSAPLILLHLDDGEAAANFATNRAGNGNFTVTGALTTYASSPSD